LTTDAPVAEMARGDRTQFLRFLAASATAAGVNMGARIVLSLAMPFTWAVVGAYLAGLSAGYLLNRLFVFTRSTRNTAAQIFWFVVVNLLGLALTLGVSVTLAYWLLPWLGIRSYVELIAHAAGVAAPVLTSYFLHKRLTFSSN
jgi:putative flippase GtrA